MSWVAVFIGFCLLIVLHEAGHFLAAKATGMRVERFFLFLGPKLWSFRRSETEYGVAAIPIGGYVKITGMNPEEDVAPEHEENAYYRKPVWKRIVVVAAGPAVNIVLCFLILFGVYLAAGRGRLEPVQAVGSVQAGMPAAKALRPGDRIVAVDGHRFPQLGLEERLLKFGALVKAHRCPGRQVNHCLARTPVRLTIRRDGHLQTISVRPRYSKAEGRALIGFHYGAEGRPLGSAAAAADEAGSAMWAVAAGTFHVFTHLFEARERKQVSGVVGISDLGHEVIEQSLERALQLLALVSLSLGLINLLPILPLDGGHILWALVEKLRGQPVSLRVIERATVVGFAVMAALMVLGLSNDIGRITGEGFQVR